jgi:predicted flavoprotein YhiN
VVRVFRGKLETLSFPLTIPRDARHHRLLVSLHGPSEASVGADALLSALAGGLGGSIGPPLPGAGPSSIEQLRHKFAQVASYDGIDARLDRGKTKHVYRNGSLLITGKTALSILVK